MRDLEIEFTREELDLIDAAAEKMGVSREEFILRATMDALKREEGEK